MSFSTATAGLKKVFTLICGTLSQVPEILHLNILVKPWDGKVSFDSNSQNYPFPTAKKDLILDLQTRKKSYPVPTWLLFTEQKLFKINKQEIQCYFNASCIKDL